jgi:hypothetical protein
MGKAIEHKGQESFKLNAFNVLDNKVCPMGSVMYPIHKLAMFLHKLGGDMYHFSHLGKL